MAYKISDGEYITDQSGAILTVDYIDELLQRIALMLKANRGKYYPDKNFGSHLSEISSEPICEYAESYIRQALDGLDGVFVKKVIKTNGEFKVQLLINDSEKEVTFQLNENL